VEKDSKFYWTGSSETNTEDDAKLMGPYETEKDAFDKAGRATEFKRILLNKCQKEFEKDSEIAIAHEAAAGFTAELKELETASPVDDAKVLATKIALRDANYDAKRAKSLRLGNIQFIGELYKLSLLQDKVMHECIMKILYKMTPDPNTGMQVSIYLSIHRSYLFRIAWHYSSSCRPGEKPLSMLTQLE